MRALARFAVAALPVLAAAGCTDRTFPDLGAGPRLEDITRKALAKLKSPDPEARREAVQSLMRRQGQQLHVVPALINAMDDPDEEVRQFSIIALQQILGIPDLPADRAKVETVWRRKKPEYEKKATLTSAERMKREKAKLKSDEGVHRMARGDFKGAEALFREAVTADPENPIYWNNRGKCYANQGRWPRAIDMYLRAVKQDPAFAPARYNLAEAYLKVTQRTGANRIIEAFGHVEVAIKLDKKKTYWAARWLKARILLHMARAETRTAERIEFYEGASESIEEAVRLAPKIAEVRKTAALVFYGRELYTRSLKEVREIYKLGYEMNVGFLAKLEKQLKRQAHELGVDPPKMPDAARPKRPKTEGPPPALRLPYSTGIR